MYALPDAPAAATTPQARRTQTLITVNGRRAALIHPDTIDTDTARTLFYTLRTGTTGTGWAATQTATAAPGDTWELFQL